MELKRMNGKMTALLIVLGFLMMLHAVPMIMPAAASDTFTYPGINGAPPNVEIRDDYSYSLDWMPAISYDPYTGQSYVSGSYYFGLVTVTEFEQEMYLDGPFEYYSLFETPNYVLDADLTFQKIGLYVPVFLLEREPWYSHEFSLEASESETLTFTIEGGFNAKKGPISVGVSGSYETSTTTEASSGWGLTFDSSDGTAESMTVYIYMEFLRVYGTVMFDGYEEREYDAILLERIHFDDFHHVTDALERPAIDTTAFLDRYNDGPDYFTDMGNYREYNYQETQDVSWGLGFEVKIGPDEFNFGAEGSFQCSTSTSLSLRHRFETYWEDDPYIDYRKLPSTVHGFWVSVGSFFSITLRMNHTVFSTPTIPSVSMPDDLDVYETGAFSASAIDPLGRDLYYVFHWGDGQKTVTDYVSSGTEVTVDHTYTEPGHRMVIVEARNYYGEANEQLQSLDVLRLEPDVPEAPVGPSAGLQGFLYSFSMSTEDDHNQRVRYEVDWGDGLVELTDYYPSGDVVTLGHAWGGSVSGINYDITVRAQNEINGLWSEFSEPARILIQRSVPGVPSISGDEPLYVGEAGTFRVQAIEPSGLPMRYTFHFSDGYSWTSDWVDSGTLVSIEHAFDSPGTKLFWADATNSHTVTTTCDPILISVIENVAPNVPAAPDGRSSGYEGITYSFTVSTTDVDRDNIRYEIAWGDGTTTLSDYFASGATATLQHAWSVGSVGGTTYHVVVRAQDSLGHWSDWSNVAQIVIGYSTPNVPSIDGPTSLLIGVSGSFSAQSVDPAGVQIRYKFYWSDGATWTSAWVNSGATVTASHAFSTPGTKLFWVEVTNEFGQTSTADPELLSVINRAPNRPNTPVGPSTGYTGVYYTFSFVTTDPDGHNVRYQIDWGDGSTTTTGYYASGSTITRSHSWRVSVYGGMYYYVKVRAQDIYGAWSSWSSTKRILIKPSSGGGPIIMSEPPLAGTQINVDPIQPSACPTILGSTVYTASTETKLSAVLGLK